MVITFNIDDYHEIVDRTESVLYYSKTSKTGFDNPVTIANVLGRVTDKGGPLQSAKKTWHLWVDNLEGIVPKLGDVIEDCDDIRWTVTTSAVLNAWGTRYTVQTERES